MKIIRLPFKVKRPLLACGADMKGAFALAAGSEAYLFDGFGDLGDPENLERYERTVRREVRRSGIRPVIIACDLHPGYFSTNFANNFTLHASRFTLHAVQHHEAHVAAAIVDNSIAGDVIGVAFDGTGYGSDGNIWGGEFFVVRAEIHDPRSTIHRYKRAAHLAFVPMPGGEAAIREPWRMAVSYLYHAFGGKWPSTIKKFYPLPVTRYPLPFSEIIDKKINSPLTSSAGRLFDAVGSLVLSKKTIEKEAELPIELERMAIELCRDKYDFDMKKQGVMMKIDCRKIIKGVVKDLSAGADKAIISSKFHNTVADMILGVSIVLRRKFRLNKVVLSGGVFQNAYLAARTKELLAGGGFQVFTHSKVSTSDSGIPIGQVAIVSERARCA